MGAYLDFTNPKTLDWWKANVKSALLDYGMASTWNDNNEFEVWTPNAFAHGFGKKAPIREAKVLHTMLMMRASREAQLEFAPQRRPFAQAMSVVMPEKEIVWTQKYNRAASLKSPAPAGKLRWLTKTEEMSLLAHLAKVAESRTDDQGSIDNWHLTLFLLDTGARYNEVASIKWDRVDLEEGLIYLYRSKVDNESGIRLTQRTWEMLKKRKEMTWPRSHVFPALQKVGFTRSVFAPGDNPRGHATAAIQSAIDAVGLNKDPSKSKVTPHTFRDTFASRLVQAGVSLLKVSHLLGHADESMTKKYAHLCPDNTGREAVAVLDGLHGVSKLTEGDDPMPTTGRGRDGLSWRVTP